MMDEMCERGHDRKRLNAMLSDRKKMTASDIKYRLQIILNLDRKMIIDFGYHQALL